MRRAMTRRSWMNCRLDNNLFVTICFFDLSSRDLRSLKTSCALLERRVTHFCLKKIRC